MICPLHFALFLLGAAVLSAAAPAQLAYEPTEVALTGTIRRQTFPGPPNYEDIAKGDAPETYWILSLLEPVDVIATNAATRDFPANTTERGVREMQLVFEISTAKNYRDFPDAVGIPVAVTGTLFHAHTAHHRTAILLTVRDLKKDTKQRP